MRISDWISDVCSSDLQLADEHKSDEELLADPVEKVKAVGGTRHPSIALPRDLYQPERINSAGLDLGNRMVLEAARTAVNAPHPLMADDAMAAYDAVSVSEAIDRAHGALDRKSTRLNYSH